MIDTHAHIYSRKFDDDRGDMLRRAFEAGITHILMPNIDRESVDGMLALEAQYPGQCLPMMGLHPCSVNEHWEAEMQEVEAWLQRRPFWGIGEMGLDLYWDKTFFEQQQEVFRIHAGWAKQYAKPLVIHTRDSMAPTLALLEEVHGPGLKGIVHCFTGTLDDARRIIDMGFLLGIGGVATYKNGGLDRVIPHIGLEQVVLETDSPYLAPVPHRGKRNEPAYVASVAQRLAELGGCTLQEAVAQTTRNARNLFQLPG
jgi:TatD DNase family protein